MSSREELLAGRTSINRRVFNAREDSESTKATQRAGMEGKSNEWEPYPSRDPEPCVPTDQSHIPVSEKSLEELLRAQVTSKAAQLREIESQIVDRQTDIDGLEKHSRRLTSEIRIATEVLTNEYGNTGRDSNAKSPIPEEGPGLESEELETTGD